MSDFSATPDDMSPVPGGPGFAIQEDVPAVAPNSPENTADDIATDKEAAPYWHPAWESVQDKFNALLDSYDGNNVMQFKDLPPAEFQIKVLAQQTVRAELTKIMEDVQRAVESVEQRPKPGKQSKSGT